MRPTFASCVSVSTRILARARNESLADLRSLRSTLTTARGECPVSSSFPLLHSRGTRKTSALHSSWRRGISIGPSDRLTPRMNFLPCTPFRAVRSRPPNEGPRRYETIPAAMQGRKDAIHAKAPRPASRDTVLAQAPRFLGPPSYSVRISSAGIFGGPSCYALDPWQGLGLRPEDQRSTKWPPLALYFPLRNRIARKPPGGCLSLGWPAP